MKTNTLLLITMLALGNSLAKDIPAVLPAPEAKAPAADKPVKVYILSGQSNMFGFGRVEGAAPTYPSIYLSADSSIKPCRMPVGDSGLLPHHVFQDEAGDAKGAKAAVHAGAYDANVDYSSKTPSKQSVVALGDVSATLPSIDGPHVVVVNGWIEVPMTGMHEVHPGFGTSEQAVASINGQEVYRKLDDNKATLTKIHLEAGKRHPLTITFTKPGSASFWMELVDINGHGDLKSIVTEEKLFPFLMDEKGEWIERNDVILCESYLDPNKFKGGRSTPLSATANGKTIGPELGFGSVMGTYHDEPVLLIKSCIGNRSLGWDCLPPGSERYEVDGTIYAGYKDSPMSWPKGTKPEPIDWYAGKQYDEFTQAIHGVLDNFDTLYPQYKDQGYEIAGFVWWQGHKDQNPVHASRYEQNLVNLIKSWRKEFKAPNAKWTIATIAFEGWRLDGPGKMIAEAQLAVSGDSGKHPEFKGNVKTIEARDYWREAHISPKDQNYHYHHNAGTYMMVGDALGRAMVELHGGKCEPTPETKKSDPIPTKPVSEMTLQEMAQLVVTTPFVSHWAKDPRKPTEEEFAAMQNALRPMILNDLLPAYVAEAPGVPAYRRHGASLMPLVTGENNEKQVQGGSLVTQYDQILDYYHSVGIDDYDWKPLDPAHLTAQWQYFSFDPPEVQEKAVGGRNREITLPAGMENWNAVDFDAAKAGWKTGKAPFGQNNGKLEPINPNCREASCGCNVKPNTLWEKEVLLMRTTFDIPPLEDNSRYRIVLGGSSHPFTGEGYAIYVNGKLFCESKEGYYKSGSGPRGGYILNDFLPELQKGKVTIAVKSFLRYTSHKNKEAPPTGHVNVWLEKATLPQSVQDLSKVK